MSSHNIEVKVVDVYTVEHYNFIAHIFVKEMNHVLQWLHEEIYPGRIKRPIYVVEAKIGDELIGCGIVDYNNVDNCSSLLYFAIDVKYRNRKLATTLLKEIDKQLTKDKIDFITLYVNYKNIKAVELYLSQGYRIHAMVDSTWKNQRTDTYYELIKRFR